MRLIRDRTPEEQENRDRLRCLRARPGKPAAIVGGIPHLGRGIAWQHGFPAA